ncbi:MAG: response regulator [Bdellovibrionales bacterium]|jgi:CheY-like chemotaxis protein|nr:response regulator [Bdellovibrionales bacterium]
MGSGNLAKLNGYKILIVDDEEDLREILFDDFTLLGATVYTASNGREAYDIALKEGPDVILSDVRMPGGDGVELLKRIRGVYETTPPHVFLLTGFSDLKPDEAETLGSQGLVPKPFSLSLLREKVTSVLLGTETP